MTKTAAPTDNAASLPAAGRPLRKDAQRNQLLVISAARDVLSELGDEATMETIAARAGVGVGTVYRHYPNKTALFDELVRIIVDELIDAARECQARERPAGCPGFYPCWANHSPTTGATQTSSCGTTTTPEIRSFVP